MTSPLLPYKNAYLLVASQSAPTIENGRVVTTLGTNYLVECYLVRQQATGTTTGADYIPTQTSPGEILPGASGLIYLYSGYALRYATASSTYEAGDDIPNGLVWTSLADSNTPDWLTVGAECSHMQGNESVKYCKIERLSGRYGNTGIDLTINKEVGGIPITVRSGELVD
jgi:hypothetical protein